MYDMEVAHIDVCILLFCPPQRDLNLWLIQKKLNIHRNRVPAYIAVHYLVVPDFSSPSERGGGCGKGGAIQEGKVYGKRSKGKH